MGRQIVRQGRVVEQHPLEDVVAGKLTGRHDGSATAVGQPASEPAQRTLFTSHPDHTVNGVLVVPPLIGRQSRVVLHPHIEDIGEVAGNTADEAGAGRHGQQHGEGLIGLAGACLHFLVNTEADGRICQLTEERGRYAAIEPEWSVGLEDSDKGAAHVLWRITAAGL